MATLKQAEAARAEFADLLAERGAHAVGVAQASDEEGWEVVAYVAPGEQPELPATLAVKLAQKIVEVPLRILHEQAFRLE